MFFTKNLKPVRWFVLATCVLLCLGAIEGWYGRLYYSLDSMGYLDVAAAIHSGDWKTAFSPYWGFSYAFLFAIVRPFFAGGPEGEWLALRALSLFILLFMWLSFWSLLKTISRDLPSRTGDRATGRDSTLLILAAFCIFTSFEICVGNVSRVSADPLVCSVIFWTFDLLSRLKNRPGIRLASLLGVVLGAGYVTKAILLPFGLVVVLILAFACWRTDRRLRIALAAAGAFALIGIPYAAALSWSFGRPTFGETGPLNYAWEVNGLEYSLHWQGGPPRFGSPVHPVRQLTTSPAVYEFAEPFHVTYPPFFNSPYWYEGYRRVFDGKRQLLAIFANLRTLAGVLARNPFAYLLALSLGIFFRFSKEGKSGLSWVAKQWQIYLPALAGIAIYIPVHVEERYISGYLCVLGALPVLFACRYIDTVPRKVKIALPVLLLIGLTADVVVRQRIIFLRMLHGEQYRTHDEWKIAMQLVGRQGLKPGDKIGRIHGSVMGYFPGWAHVAGVHIVSELADGAADEFWRSSPESQNKVLEKFKQSGALAVIETERPPVMAGPGWQPLTGTPAWVYRF